MQDIKALSINLLRPTCDPNQLQFTTTSDIATFIDNIGQTRALESLEFGVEITQADYNLYAIGPPGMGKRTIIQQYLAKVVIDKPTPPDWCYIHNFIEPNKPIALQLPAGFGATLKQDMLELIEKLRFSIPAIFESEEYRSLMQDIEETYKKREEQALKAIKIKAEKHNMTIIKTPHGFSIVPIRHGEVMSAQDIDNLPEAERQELEKISAKLRKKLTRVLTEIPLWYKERRQTEKAIEKDLCARVVSSFVRTIKAKYTDLPLVLAYLSTVEQDIIDNPKDLLVQEEGLKTSFGFPMEKPYFSRYQVNVLVGSDSKTKGAPIIFEENPNYANLLGRIEYKAQFGTLVTDFTFIKSGALHKANGGYLILDVLKVLMNPYAWESLKRVLSTKQILIEPLGKMLGISGSAPLEPEPIPINAKIILLGERFLYNLLISLDPEFKKLFKVAVDFEEHIERTIAITQQYAQFIAKLIHDNKLAAFHRNAIALVIDYCTRIANNSGRLSLHMQSLLEILSEANHWATKHGNNIVQATDVQQAIDAKIRRVDQIRKRLYEEVQFGSILLDVQGEAIGQINAISVIASADFMFGYPSRITATTRLGDEKVVDIEREVKLGGAIHSKGVLILSGFLKDRYAKECSLSLSASLVFEQTYGMVEGDSASVAELCALLSSLAAIPIKQDFAVTGSINQHGAVQAVGGVNEKIEGFFDICKIKGLTGTQGVLIPEANVKNLMLRQDVVTAVAKQQFNIYPINTIDAAMSMLTGIAAGERDKDGNYPPGSVNFQCEATLRKFADLRRLEKKGKK